MKTSDICIQWTETNQYSIGVNDNHELSSAIYSEREKVEETAHGAETLLCNYRSIMANSQEKNIGLRRRNSGDCTRSDEIGQARKL